MYVNNRTNLSELVPCLCLMVVGGSFEACYQRQSCDMNNNYQVIPLTQDTMKMCFGPEMPIYGNSGPDPWKIKFFELFFNCVMPLSNTLQTSPQPLSGKDLNSRYVKKCVLGPRCPYMVIRAHTPKKLVFLKFSFTV